MSETPSGSVNRHASTGSQLSVSLLGHYDPASTQIPQSSLSLPGALVTLSWVDIKYHFKDPKLGPLTRLFRPKKYKKWKEDSGTQILNGVIGEIRPGEVIGTMGGSGAGKTTMLNILAGRVVGGDPSGSVIVNGQPRDKHAWPSILSYVEQEDILDENLTVKEVIRFAIDMRNPNANCSAAQRERKAEKLMASLGLTAVAGRQVGSPDTKGISGGERKRLSIAMELAAEHRVLFLDEPTTGLDAASSLGLLETIRKLARKHKLSVIMSIHQPSGKMLELLDKILLLSLGRTVFFGSLSEITQHLRSLGFNCPPQENPADWILDVISVDNSSGGRYRAESLVRIADLHQVWEDIEQENTQNFARLSRRLSTASGASSGKHATAMQRLFPRSSTSSAAELGAASPESSPSGRSTPQSSSSPPGHRHRRSINSLFVKHQDKSAGEDPSPPDKYCLNVQVEFGFLLKRYGLIEFRNYYANGFLFGEFFLLSLIFGFVFFQLTTENFGGFQSRIGLFSTIPALIVGLISVDLMVLFANKRRLITRERSSRLYRLANGYTANVISVVPFRMVTVAIFATIMYYLIGLRTDSFVYFLIYLGIILLVTLFSILFGVMIATSSTGSLMAAVLRMIFVYIFILFGGSLARSTDITPIVSWLRFISPYFYALQALIQNECIGLEIAGQDGLFYVELYALNQFSIMWNAGALMIMCAGTFVFGYICMRITTKPKYIVI